MSSYDVASLRGVCSIDLGLSRYFDFSPFTASSGDRYGVLTASLPPDFEPTSDHGDFLRRWLPSWTDKMDALGWDPVWRAASASLNKSSFDNHWMWRSKGLFWENEDGFFYRALRYAVALLYSFADTLDADGISRFSDACLVTKDFLRTKLADGGFLIEAARVCDYTRDTMTVSSTGAVSASREWRGLWTMITPSFWYTTVNDGWHLNAALADYFFWWAIRLDDYVRGHHYSTADELIRLSVMRWLCAKAALAEIVEIAGTLLHEFSHASGWPYTWAECAGVDFFSDGHLECCHYNLEWAFRHRMTSLHALPLSLLDDNAWGSYELTRPNRFDLRAGERWFHKYFLNDRIDADYCQPSQMGGWHDDLWTSGHGLVVDWWYPDACAEGSSSGTGVLPGG